MLALANSQEVYLPESKKEKPRHAWTLSQLQCQRQAWRNAGSPWLKKADDALCYTMLRKAELFSSSKYMERVSGGSYLQKDVDNTMLFSTQNTCKM